MTGREVTAAGRRKRLILLMREAGAPLSGARLGELTGVSRQIVVQDIALLRAEGYSVVSTARGYYLDEPAQSVRIVKVCHTDEQVADELTTIIDLGGRVLDVMVNHKIYGRVTAPLNIRNRREIQVFVDDLKSGKSTPLLNVTSGYHFHRIAAEHEGILDEIIEALRKKNYLAELLPYEYELREAEEAGALSG